MESQLSGLNDSAGDGPDVGDVEYGDTSSDDESPGERKIWRNEKDNINDIFADLIFLPFQAVKEYPTIFASSSIFKPNESIQVRITNVERYHSITRNLVHPFMCVFR